MACMTALMTRVGGMTASMVRQGGMSARMGLVCGTSIGEYAVLWVTEGPLATVNGEFLLVKKTKKKK